MSYLRRPDATGVATAEERLLDLHRRSGRTVDDMTEHRPTALVTGASRGLGRALAADLAKDGWRVVVDARHAAALTFDSPAVTVVPGDVADAGHRRRLTQVVAELGGLDLLVNNASLLGPSPQPRLVDYPLDVLTEVLTVNVVAPLALVQTLRPFLRPGARVIDVSSDAAVEAMAGWGGYGASKAALEHLGAVLAVEEPQLRVYTVDPGDMRTAMHQEAFPGEDISDRPLPESVVPALRGLIAGELPSGRYRAADLVVAS
jgi:NAD(P)-dependent dehydrogenase (short-subunit alcohol dehydrogenase family)